MDFALALSSLSTAVSIAKDLREIDRGLSAADLKLKIAELTSALADAKLSLVELQDEDRVKTAEIERLRASFATRAETVKHRGYSYPKNADGKPMGKPYCPRCEEMDGRLSRLRRVNKPGLPSQCPICQRIYDDADGFPED